VEGVEEVVEEEEEALQSEQQRSIQFPLEVFFWLPAGCFSGIQFAFLLLQRSQTCKAILGFKAS
jgi:hypothetical protein